MRTEPLWTGYRHWAVDEDGWITFWRLDPRGRNLELTDWIATPDKRGLLQRCELAPGGHVIRVQLPAEPVRLGFWLPQAGVIGVRVVTFEGIAVPLPPTGPRWITYGSSITQCSGAYGPSETLPALVARRHSWDLVSLGFAGECHLDPVVARTLRDTPAGLISVCLASISSAARPSTAGRCRGRSRRSWRQCGRGIRTRRLG